MDNSVLVRSNNLNNEFSTEIVSPETEYNNMERVRNIIYRSENPHPIIIAIIILGAIFVFYIIYVCKFKNDYSGHWTDEKGNIYTIEHDKFRNTIVVNDGKHNKHGMIHGSVIIVYDDGVTDMGVALGEIHWVDGTKWIRKNH